MVRWLVFAQQAVSRRRVSRRPSFGVGHLLDFRKYLSVSRPTTPEVKGTYWIFGKQYLSVARPLLR
jgi:hypothetical protein